MTVYGGWCVPVHRDIVVIGGSAGALDPLKQIVTDLPAALPAAVFVVLHMAATARTALMPILNRAGGLQAVTPRDGDPVRPGYIYVATPDHHLSVHDGLVHIGRGPRVNAMRPAIDVLFRSVADSYGPRVIGVVLSGGLDDGSAGLAAIRAAGGVGVVQAPEDAMIDSMPRNAVEVASPEFVLPVERIGDKIVHLVHELADEGDTKKGKEGGGVLAMDVVGAKDTPGQATGITCPECHGSIWLQTGDGGEVAMTCRVGHSYSPETFFEIQAQNVENALWAGVRSLEEQATLAGSMASRAAKFNDREATKRYETRREMATENADILRKLIVDRTEDVA